MSTQHDHVPARSVSEISGLPLPRAPIVATSDSPPSPLHIAVSVISKRGRLSGADVFQPMGWLQGHAIKYSVAEQIVALRSAASTRKHPRIGQFGQIYVPTAVQHAVGISPRDHLLLIACPTHGVVIILSPTVVYTALSPMLALFTVSA